MKLYLIRHTKVNTTTNICYGNSDIDVASSFNNESSLVLSKLKNISFDKIYSSPLTRCKKLAQTIPFNGKIEFDNRLKELNFGDWEQKNWEEIYKLPESEKWFNNYTTTRCPNGESYNDLTNRITSFVKDIKKLSNRKNICIVTHGGPIRIFISQLTKASTKKSFEIKINFGEVITLNLNK